MTDFESINSHVSKVDLSKCKSIDKATATANLCSVWTAAAPIITMVEKFPFFPASWTAVVTALVTTMNFVCPAGAAVTPPPAPVAPVVPPVAH